MSVPLYISRTKHIQNEMEIRAEPHWPGGVHRQQKNIYLITFRAKKARFLGFFRIFRDIFNKIGQN